MSRRIPTERQVLRCIYDMHRSSFPVEGNDIGQVMVEIDVVAIANRLRCDRHILFGYLYSHLDHKYRYKSSEDSYVRLFAPRAGDLRHAINFPYLAAILGGLDQEHSKFIWSLGVSLVALALSVGAIIAQVIA